MRTTTCWISAAILLTAASGLIEAQDGPRLVQRDRDDFVLPPVPDDEEPDSPDRDVESTDRAAQSQSGSPEQAAPERGPEEAASRADSDVRTSESPSPRNEAVENYLGVFTDPLPPALADQFADVLDGAEGLLVTSVVSGAAADQAGLRINDILVRYNGEALTAPEDLKRLVVEDDPGATAELTIIRAARPEVVRVTLGQRAVPTGPRQEAMGVAPPREPFPIGVHLPGQRSIVIDRYGLRSPWIAVDWGSPLAGRRFQALTPDGRQFEVEVRVRRDRDRRHFWHD